MNRKIEGDERAALVMGERSSMSGTYIAPARKSQIHSFRFFLSSPTPATVAVSSVDSLASLYWRGAVELCRAILKSMLPVFCE
ncbi:unnamed protein product [Dibothriocephalus latus]|uniref:Uncharacterized protein n=1 Tax=Dibothriocephalus latus TaxID=60516 RepID=A0A3P6Q0G2_DIBLA|nr:unnamed protein product [Dibothriocephalus latus]